MGFFFYCNYSCVVELLCSHLLQIGCLMLVVCNFSDPNSLLKTFYCDTVHMFGFTVDCDENSSSHKEKTFKHSAALLKLLFPLSSTLLLSKVYSALSF